jgi:ATP:corrinoid adenosyltransferase
VIDGESITIEVLDTITEVSYIKYKYTAVIDGKSVIIEVLDTITEVSYIKYKYTAVIDGESVTIEGYNHQSKLYQIQIHCRDRW